MATRALARSRRATQRQAARKLILVVLSTVACGQPRDVQSGAGTAASDACSALSGQTVRWIVPFSPGGGYDVYSRLLEPLYEESLGARIVIENRSGAGGQLGARVIRDAEPDGGTIGIVNAYALLVAELADGVTGLHPVNDFTILGRIAGSDPVWVAAKGSGLETLQDVLDRSDDAPLLFGMNGVSGTGFVAASVAAELLGIEVTYLAGYPGTRESSLGLIRGEFDIGAFNFESIVESIEAGDLIPLLWISSAAAEAHPSLARIPVLAGADGVAARLAQQRGQDPQAAVALADALASIFDVGRLVVAPRDLDPDLAECLSDRLATVVRSPDFEESARRARRDLGFAEPAAVAAQLAATETERRSLADILRRHAALAHGGRAAS